MKKVLITGMSGTGKSFIISALQTRGYPAVDLDSDAWSVWMDAIPDPEHPDNEVMPGKDWVWHEERVNALLTGNREPALFVSGCASNMHQFYPLFDHIILLTAAPAVIIQRLQMRSGAGYGQTPEETARVLSLQQTIEPLLRRSAGLEIDTGTDGETAIERILLHTGL